MAPNGGAFVVFAVCVGASLMVSFAESSEPLNWVSIEAKGSYILGPSGKGCEAIPNTFEVSADGTWAKASEFDLQGSMDNDCGIEIHLTIPLESEDCETELKRNITIKKEDLKVEENKCQHLKKNITRRKENLNQRRREHEENESKILASFQQLKDAKKSFDEELSKAKNKKKIKDDIERMKEKVDDLHEAVRSKDKDLKLKETNLEEEIQKKIAASKILLQRDDKLKEKDAEYTKNLTEYNVAKSKMENKLIEMRQLFDNCESPSDEFLMSAPPQCVPFLDNDVKICTPKNEAKAQTVTAFK